MKLLLQQVEQLFQEKKYQEIVSMLTNQVLEEYNSAELYAWKARAYEKLEETELSFTCAQKSIEINSSLAIGYLARGNVWAVQKEYNKAIEDYSKAIELDEKYSTAYNGRGTIWGDQKEYAKAIEDFTKAIALNGKYEDAYYNRGNIWLDQKEYSKAIEDYTKAVELYGKYENAYNNRGIAWFDSKEYSKAIEDYTKAIELNNKSIDAYYNRGIVLADQKDYSKAIEDYTKAIELNYKYADAYYNRASSYKELGNYEEAINNYKLYIEITNNYEDYYTKAALLTIEELKKKIANAWYDTIDRLVNKIKELLLFDKSCLTHYTSLSGAKAMILQNSLFRLSEGTFLNDTSEGRELFKYLSFDIKKHGLDETIAEPFIEKPFIGSFVADNKHNDLTLWRMYGKEAQAEAKGCALTIYREQFIENLEEKLKPQDNIVSTSSQSKGNFTFYKVAYKTKDHFLIPGNDNENDQKQLNELLDTLKEKIKALNDEQKVTISQLLNDILYLFKSAEYQYEHEVRLVVQGVGFKKEIAKEAIPPKVYIELVEIIPILKKMTLGPKVERADEWAAAFNYYIKENYSQRNEQVEIVISHLPFK